MCTVVCRALDFALAARNCLQKGAMLAAPQHCKAGCTSAEVFIAPKADIERDKTFACQQASITVLGNANGKGQSSDKKTYV